MSICSPSTCGIYSTASSVQEDSLCRYVGLLPILFSSLAEKAPFKVCAWGSLDERRNMQAFLSVMVCPPAYDMR